ncbi:hypothetical protein [Stappia sp. ES.058]|uniref:hypothetical protein n=1 Tax=Stappia sp. ES.058 TaxID=1881061 RepID=UPI00087CB5AB|nr:hypothetical protein [Stappia sp. ES.058]SDU22948.1 hypothetical protein SAMN05428979_2408 [Stappia sp. ES.058]
MWKLTALLLIVIAPTLAGTFALVPMTFFGVADYEPWLLAAFAAVGALLAVPVSYFVARRILGQIGGGGRSAPTS